MTFEKLLEELEKGKTLEDICTSLEGCMVECFRNKAYWDNDFENFLDGIGAEIERYYYKTDMYSTMIIKSRESGQLYRLSCIDTLNRFDDTLEMETSVYFDKITKLCKKDLIN